MTCELQVALQRIMGDLTAFDAFVFKKTEPYFGRR